MQWLYDNWSKATIFLAVFVFMMVALYVRNVNYALFLIWLQPAVYFVHQFEEYILPGGFLNFFNKRVLGSDESGFPLTKTASFWINVPLTFIAFPLSAVLSGCVAMPVGVWTIYFSMCNALSHVVMFFKFGYNPGLVISVLLNIPVGTYAIYYLAANHIVSTAAQLAGLGIGILGQALLMIWGFAILKPKIKKPATPVGAGTTHF